MGKFKNDPRQSLQSKIKVYSDMITCLKECDQLEFRKGFDFGIVIVDPQIMEIVKQGIISYYDELRVKARNELHLLNSN
jgi:hypothetical protein